MQSILHEHESFQEGNHANSSAMKGNSYLRNFCFEVIYYYCSTLRRKGEPGTSSSPHLILIYRRWEVIELMISSFSLFTHYTSLLLYQATYCSPPHIEKMGTLIASLEERTLTKGRDKKVVIFHDFCH